jgi:hypothetical protein
LNYLEGLHVDGKRGDHMSLDEAIHPKRLPVHIRHDGEVDNELVNVRKSAGEQVTWYSDGDEFSIRFTVSPFAEHTFHVPAGGSVSSGPIRPDAPIDYYQYFITNVALAKSADPGLAVKP